MFVWTKNIAETISYFLSICKPIAKWCHIYIITTEIEKQFVNQNYTWDVVASEIKKYDYHNIFNIHYPYKVGFLSHQLNYGIKYLKEAGLLKETDYIVIYNADSRPHPKTFEWVLQDIAKSGSEIYQQLSSVLKNFDGFGNSLNGMLLKTFAILQTRFSLVHELPRLRRTISKNILIREYANAHCIGHGLFIPNKKLNELGNFSEDTMTKDLFLGFLIRATGNSIVPIPYFENIDSPTSLLRNLRQKYIWYWGPMYYPYYYKHFRKKFSDGKDFLRSMLLMVQGMLSAFAWTLSGPLFIIALILILLNFHLGVTKILFVLIIIYSLFQYFLILKKYSDITIFTTGILGKKRTVIEYILIPILSIVVIPLNSLPTYLSICMEIYSKIFKILLKKPKTESV